MRTTGSVHRWILVCIVAMTLGSGCYGKNVCFNAVTNWHGDLEWNKWAKEAFFIPIVFLVLPMTLFIDYLVVNPINFFSTDGDPMDARLVPARGAPAYCFVWTGEKFEEASWLRATEPGLPSLECRSGLAFAEVRWLAGGSLVLTDLSSGAEHRMSPEELAAPVRR